MFPFFEKKNMFQLAWHQGYKLSPKKLWQPNNRQVWDKIGMLF